MKKWLTKGVLRIIISFAKEYWKVGLIRSVEYSLAKLIIILSTPFVSHFFMMT